MAVLLIGGINLSKIPKDKITEDKNGNKWLNVAVWVNDEPDQYGNIGSVQVQQSLEERDAKAPKLYIGNLKPPKKAEVPTPTVGVMDDELDLPF